MKQVDEVMRNAGYTPREVVLGGRTFTLWERPITREEWRRWGEEFDEGEARCDASPSGNIPFHGEGPIGSRFD
jgi:hypothetical protein